MLILERLCEFSDWLTIQSCFFVEPTCRVFCDMWNYSNSRNSGSMLVWGQLDEHRFRLTTVLLMYCETPLEDARKTGKNMLEKNRIYENINEPLYSVVKLYFDWLFLVIKLSCWDLNLCLKKRIYAFKN